jgi:hypothetical protein
LVLDENLAQSDEIFPVALSQQMPLGTPVEDSVSRLHRAYKKLPQIDNNASVMSSSSGAPVMGVSEIHRLMKHLPIAIAMLFKELHLSWSLDVPRTLDDQATVAESPTSSKVFISYYHEDVQQAERVCAAVQDAGFETWMDKSDLPAGDWDDNLEKNGLRQSRAMIVIASPEAMESKEVHDEWHYAREHPCWLPGTSVQVFRRNHATPPSGRHDVTRPARGC